MKKYIVVGFTDERGNPVEVIPSTWLIDNKTCLWPNDKDKGRLKILIEECVPAQETWSRSSIKIYGKSNSFTTANWKAELARSTSSLGTDSSEDEVDKFLPKRKKCAKKPEKFTNCIHPSSEIDSSFQVPNKKIATTSKVLNNIKNRTVYSLPSPPRDVNEYQLTENRSRSFDIEKLAPCHSVTLSEHGTNSLNSETEIQGPSQPRPLSEHDTNSLNSETVLEKVLKHLVGLKKDIKDVKNEIRTLREDVQTRFQIIENPDVAAAIGGIVDADCDFPNLPISTIIDLTNLEIEITANTARATSLARFLCRGSSFNSANTLILYILKRLLKREIAMQFSLEGRQGKHRFCDMNLFNVVLASVKMKYGEEISSAAISQRIGRVLAGSPDWDGKRPERKKKIHENVHF